MSISSLCRKLVVPGDLRSYGGGNGLPRGVRQSPNISQILEENEENDVSTLLVGALRELLFVSPFFSLSAAITNTDTFDHSNTEE